MKQLLKNILFNVLVVIVGVSSSSLSLHAGGFGMPMSEEDLMQMSPEDLNKLQEELNHQIEAEIARMPAEEQEKFFQVMANVERMASEDPEMLERFIKGEMSKDEEELFVNTMVPEAIKPEAPATAAPEKTEEKKPEPVKQKEVDANLSTEQLLKSVTTKIEAFLIKMQSYPEIAIKVRNWAKNRSLVSWPADKQWTDVEKDINAFVQKIAAIMNEKNSTKKSALMTALSKNDALMTTLKALNTVLTTTEKELAVPVFGLGTIEKSVKLAIQKIINVVTNELYSKQSNATLDTLLKSYEAEDKKLKEKTEGAVKKAQQDSQAPRQKNYMKSAGQEKKAPESRSRQNYGDNYSSNRYGGGSYPSYNDYDDYTPRSSSSSSRPSSSSSGRSPNRGGSNSSAASRPSSGGGNKGPISESMGDSGMGQTKAPSTSSVAAKPSGQIQPKAQAQVKRTKQDPKDRDVVAFEDYLIAFEGLVAETKNKEMVLDRHFTKLFDVIGDANFDMEFAMVTLPEAVRVLTSDSQGVIQTLKTLTIHLSKESTETKTKYKKQIEEIYNLYKKWFDEVITSIRVVENNAQSVTLINAPLINRYAFLGAEIPVIQGITTAEGQKILDTIPTPTTIFDLKKAIETAQKEIAAFVKNTGTN
jgi:hypothetical protein